LILHGFDKELHFFGFGSVTVTALHMFALLVFVVILLSVNEEEEEDSAMTAKSIAREIITSSSARI